MEMSSADWSVTGKKIGPSYETCLKAIQWDTDNVSPDASVAFEFDASYSAEPILVSEFRLKMAGGPFAALTKQDFKEGQERKVRLCQEDCPVVFGIIPQFLYFAEVELSQLNLEKLVQIALSSHRWELRALYNVIQKFIVENKLIQSFEDVIIARRIIDLCDSETSFRLYFYRRCGYNMRIGGESNSNGRALSERVTRNSKVLKVVRALEDEISGGLEGIWETAISDGCLGNLVFYALNAAPKKRRRDISALVMLKIEPLISSDEELSSVLRYLVKFNEGLEELFNIPAVNKLASSRAIRLCSLFITRSNLKGFSPGLQFSQRYTIPLCRFNQNGHKLRPFGEYSRLQLKILWTVSKTHIEVTLKLSRECRKRCSCKGKKKRSSASLFEENSTDEEYMAVDEKISGLKFQVVLWSNKCGCIKSVLPLRLILSGTIQETEAEIRNNGSTLDGWRQINPHEFSTACNPEDEMGEDDWGHGVYGRSICNGTLQITAEEQR